VYGFFDPAGPDPLWRNERAGVAFSHEKSLGVPDDYLSGLNSPTHTYPCQRFAITLASADA
jgi:hypothetical protein